MKQIRYMVLDTDTDQLVNDCSSEDDAISMAEDLNRSVCPLVMDDDGMIEYSEQEPRYKPVRVTIKELE
nr:MAG TPA: hypothetical protein [Caudoviricetes sp.]